MLYHPFPPFYTDTSRILILGSFPSVKSREQLFFYGHPQNRFWKVLAAVFGDKEPNGIPEKRDFLARHGVALWDVIAACEITGSADSSLKQVVVNDLSEILRCAPIKRIFVNGKAAFRYYEKYTKPSLLREAVYLPSTSPANAAFSLEKLVEAWKCITL